MIETALASLSLPTDPDIYTGKAIEYLTYNYTSTADDYGDDRPQHEKYAVQVHYICPSSFDSIARRNRIKQLLFAADFTWPEVIPATDENEQHWVFECERLIEVDVDG